MRDKVDVRFLKSGQIRLRFKLSKWAYEKVKLAFSLTGYKYDNSCLDALGMYFMAGFSSAMVPTHPTNGENRLLIKLYPDEYNVVNKALSMAGEYVSSDTDALVLICDWFITHESNEKPCAIDLH